MLTPREHKAGFAARLVRAREGTDCASRAEFSRRLGFTVPETYRRYERGETEQDLAMLTKIQEITGVDLNWLVAGTPLVAQTDWLSHKETAVWSWVSDAKHIITLGDIPRSIIHTDAKAAHIFGHTRWEFAKADVINDPLWRHHKADMDAHVPIEIFVYEHTRSDGCLMRCRVDAEPMFKGARFLGYKGTAVVLNLSSA